MARPSPANPYDEFLRRHRGTGRAADTILAGIGEFAGLKTRDQFAEAIVAIRAQASEDAKPHGTIRDQIERRLRPGRFDAGALRRFSLVCRAAEVALGLSPWHHQVVCALLLHRGLIVQMPNGSGKTLAIALATGFAGLEGKAVHVATSNDYLAERDARSTGPFYQMLGLSTGVFFTAQSVRYERGILEPDGVTLRVKPKDHAAAAIGGPPLGEGAADATETGASLARLALPFECDDALKEQAEGISHLLGTVRTAANLYDLVFQWAAYLVHQSIEKHYRNTWDLTTLRDDIVHQFGADLDLAGWAAAGDDALEEQILAALRRKYAQKEELVGSEVMRQTEKLVIGQVVQNQWKNHQQIMREMTSEFGRRTSGESNTVQAYRQESRNLFAALLLRIEEDSVRYLFFLQVSFSEPPTRDTAKDENETAPAAGTNEEVPIKPDTGSAEPPPAAAGQAPDAEAPSVLPRAAGSEQLVHETNLAYRVDADLTEKDVLACDVVYSRIEGLAFAFLRDHLADSADDLAFARRDLLVVDECDSVLLDDVRIAMDITRDRGEQPLSLEILQTLHRLAQQLRPGRDFVMNGKSIRLTYDGLEALRRITGRDFFTREAGGLARGIVNALSAAYAYRRDEDYVRMDNEIVLVDAESGRLLFGRRFTGGLQEALLVKEGFAIGSIVETESVAKISHKYFVQVYSTVSGTSGAVGRPKDYRQLYGLDTVAIEPYAKTRREHHDLVFRTKREILKHGVIPTAVTASQRGQPVLINVPQLKDIPEVVEALKRANVPFQALDGYTVRTLGEEAEKIQRAGMAGLVTVSSKIAARGTDIVLAPDAIAAGGLYVIGVHREFDRRFDDQLCGRAGRHGDPGDALFVLSLEDDLLSIFGGPAMQNLMIKLGMEEGVPIESEMITHRISSAQQSLMRQKHEARSKAVDMDDILDRHRMVVYKVREKILVEEDLTPEVMTMLENWVDSRRAAILKKGISREWSGHTAKEILGKLSEFLDSTELHRIAQARNRRTQAQMVQDALERVLKSRIEAGLPSLRLTILSHLDEAWCRFLTMEVSARAAVSLYAQDDPAGIARYERMMEERFDSFFYDLGEEILGAILAVSPRSVTVGA